MEVRKRVCWKEKETGKITYGCYMEAKLAKWFLDTLMKGDPNREYWLEDEPSS